jgi:hypothetical protein
MLPRCFYVIRAQCTCLNFSLTDALHSNRGHPHKSITGRDRPSKPIPTAILSDENNRPLRARDYMLGLYLGAAGAIGRGAAPVVVGGGSVAARAAVLKYWKSGASLS